MITNIEGTQSVKVIANPKGSVPRLAMRSHPSHIPNCPPGGPVILLRGDAHLQGNPGEVQLAGCSEGEAKVELRRASDDLLLDSYTLEIRDAPVKPPIAFLSQRDEVEYTATPTRTRTPTPTATHTPIPTAKPIATATPTATQTLMPVPTHSAKAESQVGNSESKSVFISPSTHLFGGAPSQNAASKFVSAGANHICWLNSGGEIFCRGFDDAGQVSAHPEGDGFIAVSVGLRHSCALDGGGRIHCWGSDERGQASPPAGGGFAALAAGDNFTCALHPEDGLKCWGSRQSR